MAACGRSAHPSAWQLGRLGKDRGRSLAAAQAGPEAIVLGYLPPQGRPHRLWEVVVNENVGSPTKAGAPGPGHVPLSVGAASVNLIIPVIPGDMPSIKSSVLRIGVGGSELKRSAQIPVS